MPHAATFTSTSCSPASGCGISAILSFLYSSSNNDFIDGPSPVCKPHACDSILVALIDHISFAANVNVLSPESGPVAKPEYAVMLNSFQRSPFPGGRLDCAPWFRNTATLVLL